MKFLYSWLKELLPDLHDSPQDLVPILLNLGFEVEDLAMIGPAFSGVVIGEVLSAEKHPNADRLRLCKVTDGSSQFSVVCGAPNVAAGQRVAFARVGARLPGGLEIKRTKIRGTESEGMICSASELGQENGKSEGILVLPANMQLGRDYAQTLGGPDAVLDVNITPNRPDCMSHIGLARELKIYRNLKFVDPIKQVDWRPDSLEPGIDLKDPDCSVYLGCPIEGLSIKASPSWLSNRLTRLGMRSINNAVDVTNYVLLESGQPLHLFDLDKLRGDKITVRAAQHGERIRALDGKEYDLSPENLVIADAVASVAIAGVMGGEGSGISDATKRAFLEVAHFAPARIRRSSRRLRLRTDSSQRFERGTDPDAPRAVMGRAVQLLKTLCGPDLRQGKVRGHDLPRWEGVEIRTSVEEINMILGTAFPAAEIVSVLKSFGEMLPVEPPVLEVATHEHRRDLKTPQDLAEEVARYLGYESIEYKMEEVHLPEPVSAGLHDMAERLRNKLRGLGFSEACNYDFVSPAELERLSGSAKGASPLASIANPLSTDWTYLRPTLAIGLLRSAELNFNRGAEGIRLFEIGKTYAPTPDGVNENPLVSGLMAGPWPPRASWKGERREPDLFDVKAIVEALVFPARLTWRPSSDGIMHPKASLEFLLEGRKLGHAGVLHPDLVKRWGLRCQSAALFQLEIKKLAGAGAGRFQAYSPYPSVARDLSFVLDETSLYKDLEAAVRSAAGPDLARLDLIDTFAGKGIPEGKKSLTLRLTFSRMDRTLRDEEISSAVNSVVKKLEKELGAQLRA